MKAWIYRNEDGNFIGVELIEWQGKLTAERFKNIQLAMQTWLDYDEHHTVYCIIRSDVLVCDIIMKATGDSWAYAPTSYRLMVRRNFEYGIMLRNSITGGRMMKILMIKYDRWTGSYTVYHAGGKIVMTRKRTYQMQDFMSAADEKSERQYIIYTPKKGVKE